MDLGRYQAIAGVSHILTEPHLLSYQQIKKIRDYEKLRSVNTNSMKLIDPGTFDKERHFPYFHSKSTLRMSDMGHES